ncbi:MAG: hypothetical protein Q9160_002882 [Pyrenula sp. 1 TL-2023]
MSILPEDSVHFWFVVITSVLQDTLKLVEEHEDMSSTQRKAAVHFMGRYVTESMNLLKNHLTPFSLQLHRQVLSYPTLPLLWPKSSDSYRNSISKDDQEELHESDAKTLTQRLFHLNIGDLAAILPPSWAKVSDQSEHSIKDPMSLLVHITLQNIPLDTVKSPDSFLQECQMITFPLTEIETLIIRISKIALFIGNATPSLQAEIYYHLKSSQQKRLGSVALSSFAESLVSTIRKSAQLISCKPITTSRGRQTIFRFTTALLCIMFILRALGMLTASGLNTMLTLLGSTGMYGMAAKFFVQNPIGTKILQIFEAQIDDPEPESEPEHQTRNDINAQSADVHESHDNATEKIHFDKASKILAGLSSLHNCLMEALKESGALASCSNQGYRSLSHPTKFQVHSVIPGMDASLLPS